MMAENRKQPFGYELREGRMSIRPEEADTVRWVFGQYVAGLSYRLLVEELNHRGAPYLPGKSWNKNMVARMLEDRRYAGDREHPAIVDADMLERVREIRDRRGVGKKKDDAAKELQRLAVCGLCGEKVIRLPYVHGRERWSCPVCRGIKRAVTDDILTENTRLAMKRLLTAPSAVRVPDGTEEPDHGAERMERDLRERLMLRDSGETELMRLAFGLAAARYARLSDAEYETNRISRCLRDAVPGDALNTGLLREITAAVLIHPDGNVRLKLKNNQII